MLGKRLETTIEAWITLASIATSDKGNLKGDVGTNRYIPRLNF